MSEYWYGFVTGGLVGVLLVVLQNNIRRVTEK